MIGSISLGVIAGVGVIIASVGMIWWATTSRTALPSKRVAVVGVIVLALLIGVIPVVRVTSGPAYEATAEIVIESAVPTFHNLPEDPALAEEVSIFGSPRVAGDAVSLAADLVLAVLLTWRWWPDPSRSPRLEDWFGTREA